MRGVLPDWPVTIRQTFGSKKKKQVANVDGGMFMGQSGTDSLMNINNLANQVALIS